MSCDAQGLCDSTQLPGWLPARRGLSLRPRNRNRGHFTLTRTNTSGRLALPF